MPRSVITTSKACKTLTWVFVLIACSLLLGYYLFYTQGHDNSIQTQQSPQ
ncbi:hypothetical protein [Acidipila rosea]|uniref:Uncharacterized protein n=1 Tax=Acidipila rosea TaxID=768535 RepID=A0A4R1LAQ2_9BACT|nr:hypothetical protein [Acidipila rosea]MBW4026943.1 hypothetical protein [Acidobacteriota bacterium]MBW4045011.1 hypothetical protein [Acidobacteriota bacterium]TCK75244.1 hypothetical protein C7378_0224 [Acidipila rosea]